LDGGHPGPGLGAGCDTDHEERRGGGHSLAAGDHAAGRRGGDARDAERLQGFTADWTAPAERVGRASMRWSLVGNAVAAWLGERLCMPERYEDGWDMAIDTLKRWPTDWTRDVPSRW
jgi:hypothetical protein